MASQSDEYEIKGPDIDAKGVFTVDGFLVKAGSTARRAAAPSAKSVMTVQEQLMALGVLKEDDGRLRFTRDHLFHSPSGAAAAVLGRTANGWLTWKRADGQTLSEVKRVSRESQAPLLDESQRQRIMERHRQLLNDGKLATLQQLEREYALFRERFGPAVLSGLDGETLLQFMHDHTSRESLVYWLEFKNDEEFATRKFGSIAGGSALKFRIFRRKETGNWQAGGEKANQPKDISLAEAITIARSHRDQLLNGVALLEKLGDFATDEEYAELQDQMDEASPDVSRLAWGHKYFSLLFPNKLEDYHMPDYQRFHLLKLLQLPPEGDGRYVCGARFVAAAKEVGLPMNHFTGTLASLHGRLHRYWRIGTTMGKSGESFWPMMRERSRIAVGWTKLGDVSWLEAKKESRERLRALIEEKHPNHPSAIGRDCSQLCQFVLEITEGDVVVAADGMKILGVGRVIGEYEFHPEFAFPHQREVDWISEQEWRLPEPQEGLQSTVRELGKFNVNLLAIERLIQTDSVEKKPIVIDRDGKGRPPRLSGVPGRIQSILERKGQVILFGPPGTGKTFWAERTANDLASLSAFGKLFDALDEPQRRTVVGDGASAGLVRICCFHPAYGYEDFLEGYRPLTVNGQISFVLRDGVFKSLCRDAQASPSRNYYLIIDEINRGDIPRIFGELLTVLEKDKRGKRIILPLSQEFFSVPRNVFVIGAMNTADRSISLLDAALRRRFGFVEMMPDSSVLKDSAVGGIALKAWLDALNTRVREYVGRDARNLQIGHAYLMHGGIPLKDLAMLKRAVRDDIVPLLEEYCYEDYGALANILGEQLVDPTASRIRHELFDDGQEDALVQGLLTPFAEISTSSEALAAEESRAATDGDEEEDEP